MAKFDELGIKIKALSGASIGAFVAVAYASGLKPKEILEIIKTSDFKKAFKLNFPFNKSFFKIDVASKTIQNLVKFSDLKELNTPVYISAVDLVSGEVVYLNEGEILKLVLGSCAITPVFEAVKYNDYLLADGCFKDNLPITPLKKYGLDIWAVDLQPFVGSGKGGIIRTTKQALKIALTPSRAEICKNAIYLTNPNLNKFSLFSFKEFDALFELGYIDAEIKIKEKYDTNSI